MRQDLFVCPRCRTTLERVTPDRLTCPKDGLEFWKVEGIWRFLLPEGEAHYARFMREYEAVRRAEGRGSQSADYYRALPFKDLSRRYNIAHPNLFVYPGTDVDGDDDELEWVHPRSLVHNDLVLVPARQVFAPYAPSYRPAPDGRRTSFSSTNGLASGNTIEEATLHALLEAVERDAEALSTCGGSSAR